MWEKLALYLTFYTLDYLSNVACYLSSVSTDFAHWTNSGTCVQFEPKRRFYMIDRICPIDGRPCEKNCPDRYIDDPRGGCILTDVKERGGKIIPLGGGDYVCVINPHAFGL